MKNHLIFKNFYTISPNPMKQADAPLFLKGIPKRPRT